MNEKSLEILSMYQMDPYKTFRIRGGFFCETNKGAYLLTTCRKGIKSVEREDLLLKYLEQKDSLLVDSYVRNIEEQLISVDEQETHYVLKKAYHGRECDWKSLEDLKKASMILGILHKQLEYTPLQELHLERTNERSDYGMEFRRKLNQMKRIRTYIESRSIKNTFESNILIYFQMFYEKGVEAFEAMKETSYKNMFERATKQNSICHGNFTYHNVLFDGNRAIVMNFDQAYVGIQIKDLYDFLRKCMEKNQWNVEVGKYMLDSYHKERHISGEELQVLKCLLLFPEKFYKIINYYMSHKKNKISERNLEKLMLLVHQEEVKMNFIYGILR